MHRLAYLGVCVVDQQTKAAVDGLIVLSMQGQSLTTAVWKERLDHGTVDRLHLVHCKRRD